MSRCKKEYALDAHWFTRTGRDVPEWMWEDFKFSKLLGDNHTWGVVTGDPAAKGL